MRLAHYRNRERAGFTLIELLVVIAIIALLFAMTSAGVFKALQRATDVSARSDIEQLQQAVVNFKAKFGFLPPSRIWLCEKLSDYNTLPAGVTPAFRDQSISYLQLIFGSRLTSSNPSDMNFPWTCSSPTMFIDWNSNRQYDAGGYILEGDQCLVFFLGGVQTGPKFGNAATATDPPNFLGFSTNKSNPCALGGQRIDPFFEFKSNRVNTQVMDELNKANFYTYMDPYGKMSDPLVATGRSSYAYFSSYKTRNGYQIGDCARLGVQPYTSDGIQFYNPSTFQIICAGRDRAFGQGGPTFKWTPATANLLGNGPYRDDLTNFYDLPLGLASKN